MNTFLPLAILAVLCSTACGLECRLCSHQTFPSESNSEELSKMFDMWDQACLDDPENMETVKCDEEVNATATKTVCFSFSGSANFSYNSEDNGTVTEYAYDVELYMRGCLNVSKDTTNGEVKDFTMYTGEMQSQLPKTNNGSYGDITGTLEICDDSNGCNEEDLDPVSASVRLVMSAVLLLICAIATTFGWH